MSATTSKLNALTGLRFLAAAAIVVIHWRQHGLPRDLLGDWPLGDGVSFFFVLSGFVLTFAYPNLPNAASVRRFRIARFARLWPLHLATLAMVIAILHGHLSRLGPDQASPLVVLTNISLTQAWVPVSNLYWGLNVPSWSISTEFFFYLAFPWLLRDFAATWWWKLLAAFSVSIGLVIFASIITPQPPTGVHPLNWLVSSIGLLYVNPLARLPEFVAGMCLALAFDRLRPRLSFGLAAGTALELVTVGVFILAAGQVLHYGHLIHASFGIPAAEWARHGMLLLPATMLLIFVMALGRGAISRVIGSRIGVLLGDISFAIYLLHYVMVLAYEFNRPLFKSWTGSELLIFSIAVLLAGSWLLFHYVEMPMRRLIVTRFAQPSAGRLIPNASATDASAAASAASPIAAASMRSKAARTSAAENDLEGAEDRHPALTSTS